MEFESLAISMLLDFVEDKKVCCNTGNRTLCSGCLSNEEFSTYMSENDFNVTSDIQLSYTAYTNITTQIKEYAKLTFIDGTETIDVNQTIKDLVIELSDLSDNIRADIRIADINGCTASFDLVDEHPFPEEGNIYFHIKVIGQESMLGDQIAIKLETNFQQGGKGTGTLYILNGSNFDIQKIIDKTKEYFQLAGLKIKVKPLLKGNRLGKTDGFAVIGNTKQKAVDLIFGTTSLNIHVGYYDDPQYFPNPACPACRPNEFLCKERNDFLNWPIMDNKEYKDILNPERSGLRGIVVDVSELNGDDHQSVNYSYSNNNDDNKLRKPGGTYRSIAFLILHGTAHQAGFYHDIEPKGKAYCDSGLEISNNLGCNNGCKYTTYEKLIEWAKKEYKHMIGQTNARYGY